MDAAREAARDKNSGRFGEQAHSAPDISLPTSSTLQATGPSTTVVCRFDDRTGEVKQMSMQDARKFFGMPAEVPAETVLETVKLMNAQHMYADEQPTYADPGDESPVDTSHWDAPDECIRWTEAVAWRSDQDRNYVQATSEFRLSEVEYDEGESIAAESIVSDYLAKSGVGYDVTADGGRVFEGRMLIDFLEGFEDEEFAEPIVRAKLNDLLRQGNPRDELRRVKREGLVLSNQVLNDAHKANAEAAIYAANAGRVPNDAEAVAIVRHYKIRTALQDGYLPDKRSIEVNGGMPPSGVPAPAKNALNLWIRNRG
jgi:hypothetical protein